MSLSNADDLIHRIAEVDPRSGEGRIALLTALYAAGFPTQRTEDVSVDSPPHTLLLWLSGPSRPVAHLFVIPDDAADERLDESLDAANGVVLRDHRDCSVYQLAAFFRILVQTGLAPAPALLTRIGEARIEVSPSSDLGKLPGEKEVKATHDALRQYRAGSLGGAEAPNPRALDVTLSRAVGVADLLERPTLG